ncbi:MAG: hypothetical protein ICV79_08205, partial [Flavisolibacter sp.]|nr:hypothetical protein [Flavisolibacter sp.]
SWLKIPVLKREEYIIIGWAGGSERGDAYYRSLLFGEYRDDKLYYVHHHPCQPLWNLASVPEATGGHRLLL